MTINITDKTVALWYVELDPGSNFLAALDKTANGHHLVYRFRYDGTDPRPFDGNDERHWMESHIKDTDTERVLGNVRSVVTVLAGVTKNPKYEILMGPGGVEAFCAALAAMPWSHMRAEPLES